MRHTSGNAMHVPPAEVFASIESPFFPEGSAEVDLLAVEPGSEVIVYCQCPNEYTAAKLAKILVQHGFKRVRPLLGGIDAWIAAGHDVEPAGDAGAKVIPLSVQRSPT